MATCKQCWKEFDNHRSKREYCIRCRNKLDKERMLNYQKEKYDTLREKRLQAYKERWTKD